MGDPAVPEAWPPADGGGDAGETVVPLFPLNNVWLFPKAVMPLLIFEPRYRQMIEDSLDGPGRLVIGTVVKGHESEILGTPPVYPIAGLGEIGRHERRPDGCYVILLVGVHRVQAEERASDRLYRQVAVREVEESPVPPDRAEDLRERLGEAILERTGEFLNLPDDMPIESLVDLLMLRTPLPHEVVKRLYCELDLQTRAELALAEHGQRGPGTKSEPDGAADARDEDEDDGSDADGPRDPRA